MGLINGLVKAGIAKKLFDEARKPQNQAKVKRLLAQLQSGKSAPELIRAASCDPATCTARRAGRPRDAQRCVLRSGHSGSWRRRTYGHAAGRRQPRDVKRRSSLSSTADSSRRQAMSGIRTVVLPSVARSRSRSRSAAVGSAGRAASRRPPC
jgi:hypothetical protein